MRPIRSLVVLALASVPAFAGDPALDPGLKVLAPLVGTWTADGEFTGRKYKENVTFVPICEGKVVIEKAQAIDETGAVIHEDRIVFWLEGEKPKAMFVEQGLGRTAVFDVTGDRNSVTMTPVGAGPSLVFTFDGADKYSYVYRTKDADGKEIQAVAAAQRTDKAYPDRAALPLVPALAAAEKFLGKLKGSTGPDPRAMVVPQVDESTEITAILGGTALEIRSEVKVDAGTDPEYILVWPSGDGLAAARITTRGCDTFVAYVEGAKLSITAAVKETPGVEKYVTWTFDDKGGYKRVTWFPGMTARHTAGTIEKP